MDKKHLLCLWLNIIKPFNTKGRQRKFFNSNNQKVIMGIVFATILPHGFELLAELYPFVDLRWKRLADGIEKIAKKIVEKEPNIIIIATPHNLRIREQVGIIITETCEGEIKEKKKDKKIELKWEIDREFALSLYQQIKEKDQTYPIVAVNYGSESGEYSKMTMDWGTFIPLWFIKKEYKRLQKEEPKIVVITPSREIDWEKLVKLGYFITESVKKENKQAVFIASADQSHAHDVSSIYGFDPISKEFDEKVSNLITANKLEEIKNFDKNFVDNAKADSFWQMMILVGIIEKNNLKNAYFDYDCPTYFGMVVASYEVEK